MTGIGVTAHVLEIEWMARNPNYPAEPKFFGVLTTSTGESHRFVTDRRIPVELELVQVVGRMVGASGNLMMYVTEVFDDDPG